MGVEVQLWKNLVLRFNRSESSLSSTRKKDESVEHIDEADVEKVSKAVTDCANWYDNSMNQINNLQKNQDPPVFTANFKAQYDSLVSTVDKIMNTPKPTPPPPAPEEKKEEENSAEKTEEPAAEKTDSQEADKNSDEKAPHMDVD